MRLMVDIETMSTHNTNALVLSVGAVGFEILDKGALLPQPVFYGEWVCEWVLDIRSQLLAGRVLSESTQAFWREQPLDAKRPWGILERPAVDIPEFCIEFQHMYATQEVTEIWANGMIFDLGNIASLFDEFGLGAPWKYNHPRDYRTFRQSFSKRRERPENLVLVPHKAVDDCVHQVWDMWERWPAPDAAQPAPYFEERTIPRHVHQDIRSGAQITSDIKELVMRAGMRPPAPPVMLSQVGDQ